MSENQAVGYLRTSSRSNVGEDKDSEVRQRAAVERYAGHNGLEIVDWYYDAAVSGDDLIEDRPGFLSMLDRIDANGVRIVLVEDATRFARHMRTSELGMVLLISRGVRLIDSRGEDLTDTDDEMRVAFRQMAIMFSQLEKTRLVKKLKAARDRKSAELGRRVEGTKKVDVNGVKEYQRTGHAATDPEWPKTAERLRAAYPKWTLRAIADYMKSHYGYMRENGEPFCPGTIARWIRP